MGKDRVVIYTSLLWSAFKMHATMAEFEENNFEDHPSISSEYVKFLAMNSGSEAVDVLQGKFKLLQDQVKDMQNGVKQADKKAENAMSACEGNKKVSENLDTRMRAQEGKK